MKKIILTTLLLLSINTYAQDPEVFCISVVGDGSNVNVVGDGSNISVVGDGSNVSVVGDGSNISQYCYTIINN